MNVGGQSMGTGTRVGDRLTVAITNATMAAGIWKPTPLCKVLQGVRHYNYYSP